jgi:hypothetical protein
MVGARIARPCPQFCSAGAPCPPLRLPFSHSLTFLYNAQCTMHNAQCTIHNWESVGDDGNRPVYAESGGIAVGNDGNRPENQRADCHPPLRCPRLRAPRDDGNRTVYAESGGIAVGNAALALGVPQYTRFSFRFSFPHSLPVLYNTMHNAQCTIHNSQFTIHNSQFTINLRHIHLPAIEFYQTLRFP